MTSELSAAGLGWLTLVSEPVLNSAGRLAYVSSWLDLERDAIRASVTVAAGHAVGLRPSGDQDSRCPRWSPDGSALAMIVLESGSARPVLWRAEAGGLEFLADAGGHVTDLAWSPDGRLLAVTTVRRTTCGEAPSLVQPRRPVRADGEAGLISTQTRIVVLPADGTPGWEVLRGAGSCWHPRWSPDGTTLAFLAVPPADDNTQAAAGLRLSRTPGRPATPAALTALGAGAVAFAWSPAGDEIAYLAPRPGDEPDLELRLYRSAAADDRPVAELAAGWDRSLGTTVRGDDERGSSPGLLWSAATGMLYFPVAEGGCGAIGWASPDGNTYGLLTGGERACLEPGLDPAGRRMAFVSSAPADPGDVCIVALDSGDEQRVTNINPRPREQAVPETRLVTATSQDGTPVQGWLTLPPGKDDQPSPLVVSIHGGPHYPVGWRFSAETQRLAGAGYAVLSGNPRGSGGYGRQHAAVIQGRWGSADWQDVAALADLAAADPAIDGDRIAVTGVSYGGYLTQHAITQTRRFSAAISENGISNLFALWGSGAADDAWLSAEMGGPPWAIPDRYLAASPLAHADQIGTPLLLIHAELDQNCPIAQSEQMLAALRRLGRDVSLVRLSGEGHLINLIGRPSRRLARASAVDDWLRRYLRPAGRTADDG